MAVTGEILEGFINNHLKNIQHDIYDISFIDTLDTADKCSIFCKADRRRRNLLTIKEFQLIFLIVIHSWNC